MIQQEKSAGNLNAAAHNITNILQSNKSKIGRSLTSNNQSLEQIMKKANEIIKKSKNSSLFGARPDISDILHPLTDSFVTMTTTADSLQKNSQSTNREVCKISPFVTGSSPENYESNPHSSDKSKKAISKIPIANQDESQNQSLKINIAKQLHNNYMISETDYIFENFDSVYRITFNPSTNQGTHINNFAQKNGSSHHQSYSANARDNDDTCRISLTQVFERVHREEKSQNQAKPSIIPTQNQQQQQIITQQQQTTQNANPIHIRSSSSIINTPNTQQNQITKSIQQTIQQLQAKTQSQQQQIQLLQQTKNQQLQQQKTSQQQQKDTNQYSSQQSLNAQQPSQQQQQVIQTEIEQYLKKPLPSKVKTQNVTTMHPHPPLPQSSKNNLNGYNSNHFNTQRFRYRSSLRDKENIAEAANTSIGQINTTHGQLNTSIGQLNTSIGQLSTTNGQLNLANGQLNSSNLLSTINGQLISNSTKNINEQSLNNTGNQNNISQALQYQSIQINQAQQRLQQSQQQHQKNTQQHTHQRSTSNITDFNKSYLNIQQNSNSLQNSFGFYRPRIDSTSGSSYLASERVNAAQNEQTIKNSAYASVKERSITNVHVNDTSCDKSLNYSSMRNNTSYNGSSNTQATSSNNLAQQSSRTGSFQLNIPSSQRVTSSKQNVTNSVLNSLFGGQKVQQPQPTNNNTSSKSKNTNISQITYNPPHNQNSSLGNRSTSVPRANVGYILQKKQI